MTENIDMLDVTLEAMQKQAETIRVLRGTLDKLEKFHPRAMKLLRKEKNFIVIAEDEPYFIKAYDMIRKHEQEKGTWTDGDERLFKAAFDKRAAEVLKSA